MPCNLYISGKKFHVDSFLEQTQLGHLTYSHFHIGEPRVLKSYGLYEDNGCSFATSNAEFDNHQQQVLDTIHFLTDHSKNFELLKSVYEIEDFHLDFGFNADFPDGFTETYILSNDLLKLCGDLGIDIMITTYLSSRIEK